MGEVKKDEKKNIVQGIFIFDDLKNFGFYFLD